MKVHFRRAAPSDAAAIARVAEEAFAETIDAASPHFSQVLERGSTFVATIGHDLVGFVDGFLTESPEGETRYELDLLAVSETVRDRCIGGALVSRAVAEAGNTSASILRTLVVSRNTPMRRLCQRLGFKRAPRRFALYVAAPGAIAEPNIVVHQAHLITVTTLTYSGIWLEGILSQDSINHVHTTASDGGIKRIGAVVANDDLVSIRLLTVNNFDIIGVFDWWTLSLGSG